MSKLYFRYGAMGSSKTANALMVNFNYEERGMRALLLVPSQNTRDEGGKLSSRIGLSADCQCAGDFISPKRGDIMTHDFIAGRWDAVIVDEAQFLTEPQVDTLAYIADAHNIPVICYGLRTDFQGKFFPGSKRLMEVADKIEEIKTVCWCGAKATCNARYNEHGICRSGEQVEIGGNEKYIALCRKHFRQGNLGSKKGEQNV